MREPLIAGRESLGTAAFDEAFSGRLGMIFTDRTVSWISSRPIEYYDGTAYLLRQAGTQIGVAALIVMLLLWLALLSSRRRIGAVVLAAVASSAATYGTLANWWGLAPAYAIGESVNLIIGWTLAAGIASAVLTWRKAPRVGAVGHG